MEFYKKPIIADRNFLTGVVPIILSSILAGLKVGAPIIAAAAAIASKKGDNIIDSTHTSALTARKDFVFA